MFVERVIALGNTRFPRRRIPELGRTCDTLCMTGETDLVVGGFPGARRHRRGGRGCARSGRAAGQGHRFTAGIDLTDGRQASLDVLVVNAGSRDEMAINHACQNSDDDAKDCQTGEYDPEIADKECVVLCVVVISAHLQGPSCWPPRRARRKVINTSRIGAEFPLAAGGHYSEFVDPH